MFLLDNAKTNLLTSAGGDSSLKVEQAKQQEWAELKMEISPQGSRLFHWIRNAEGLAGKGHWTPHLVPGFTGEI